jgi:hypothetical protein
MEDLAQVQPVSLRVHMTTEQQSLQLEKLEAFSRFLPDGDVQEERVICYHLLLDEIEGQIDQNLNYFRIPDQLLTEKDETRFCCGWVFRTKLEGALNVLTALHRTNSLSF